MKSVNRRTFIGGLGLAAGGAALLNARPGLSAEPPPETTTIRLIRETKFAVFCYAPQYVAEALLRAEGFTDIQYVPKGTRGSEADALVQDNADISAALGVDWIMPVANKDPVTILAGLHAGCIEVFADKSIKSVSDLRGKRLAITGLGLSLIHI